MIKVIDSCGKTNNMRSAGLIRDFRNFTNASSLRGVKARHETISISVYHNCNC